MTIELPSSNRTYEYSRIDAYEYVNTVLEVLTKDIDKFRQPREQHNNRKIGDKVYNVVTLSEYTDIDYQRCKHILRCIDAIKDGMPKELLKDIQIFKVGRVIRKWRNDNNSDATRSSEHNRKSIRTS